MADLSLARRYAQALFDAARKSQSIEQVEQDLEGIDNIIRAQPNLVRVLRAPTIARPEKKELVRRLFEGQLNPLTLRFLYLLVDKRREAVLPEIERAFRAMANAARNILPVTATVAVPLSAEERTKLIATLSKRTGKTVELAEEVDAELISGVVLRVGDTIIDGSVSGQLRRLRQQLLDTTGTGLPTA